MTCMGWKFSSGTLITNQQWIVNLTKNLKPNKWSRIMGWFSSKYVSKEEMEKRVVVMRSTLREEFERAEQLLEGEIDKLSTRIEVLDMLRNTNVEDYCLLGTKGAHLYDSGRAFCIKGGYSHFHTFAEEGKELWVRYKQSPRKTAKKAKPKKKAKR